MIYFKIINNYLFYNGFTLKNEQCFTTKRQIDMWMDKNEELFVKINHSISAKYTF